MAQAKRGKMTSPVLAEQFNRMGRETALVVCVAVSLYLLISLFSYNAADPAWSNSGVGTRVENWGGRFGAWLTDLFLHGFGNVSYLFPIMIGWLGWRVYRTKKPDAEVPTPSHRLATGIGFVATIIGGCGIENLHFANIAAGMPFAAGGVLGSLSNQWLVTALGFAGATVLQLTFLIAGVTFFTGLSWFWLMDQIGDIVFRSGAFIYGQFGSTVDRAVGVRARRSRKDSVDAIRKRLNTDQKQPPRIEPKIQSKPDSGRMEREKQSALFDTLPSSSSVLPPLSLLDEPDKHQPGYSKQALEAMSRLLEKKLADFNVDVEVVAVHPGPVITRFEIEPAPGIKASQIASLSRDLARALSTVSVRIVDNIPGKTVIGLEVPNENRETVRLVEGLSSQAYEEANTPLALMLGKDISGLPVITDLCKMPHLLIAGTTGSGKSVCINALIVSMVYKSSPQDVRMIMVDPKMLELSVYDDIPHLLTPVVTDMKEAANALRWCIGEMERRYKLMSALGVRNISGYNRKIKTAGEKGETILDPTIAPEDEPQELVPLAYIVIVIDELADLMIVVGKKVEELITRLAQKGRASGLHLILATQRPSVDVITGLIKANIPSRIAFQVSSRVDSRTVLDQIGAEQLLGHGDMLYLPPGTSSPARVHGSFVSDQEVHRIAEYLKKSETPLYEPEIIADSSPADDDVDGFGSSDVEEDPLYDHAIRLVTETRRASISAVQRHLRVGYNRAARMIEAMEASGVVGPVQSNGKREVLVAAPPE